ncbi:TPA: methyltransferase domain-containing protein [Legionella pneumophila subsp. pneumophila]|jgi:protein-L-isoaspartate(D-aspartate) O-methyltransferase|uniref:Protein-L-isoaspartate O-methyltransferase n=2 Tax=Legionella pneumophila TaxID=446 RepID=A0A378KDQ6_LEGPN|nr:protein-L-isoaspartate O-methyltransferase [Legionella pneumophila subsp. pascullei]AOW52623.1 protein-L-isoaspartate O-methyltransferase [Legionella pneumophila subsp. pneumophila]RYW83604.1 protein-L-isoaspartate O-methyltransferase [Legionella pneumophila]AMP94717.1 protein-L-isoaspartate O-methyltransferase [Legionella pneumophila subsp. pascullei]AOW56473.1 protein-L-isoaspartate O-methyltransferase [Legionella pneumophila subsp. pneumophila]
MIIKTVEQMNHSARINMIKQQLRTGDVLNESILDLYDEILRHEFVPELFSNFAYSDMQIPLAHGQRMLTPLEEGTIIQALDLKGHETVLEVGTGTGFMTALLSKLCKKVISIDYYSDFTANAKRKLEENNCNNVELITGDACRGWLESAPYDVMVFTGAMEKLTDTHKLQILPGGKLFAILGKSPVMQAYLFQLDHNAIWTESMLFETDIPPLVDQLKPKEFVF